MKKRNETMDVIRIISFATVVCVHFLLNCGFYNIKMDGTVPLLMCIWRSAFIICVPLFITLTGYLMNQKEPTKKYYKGIWKTLIFYLICSIIYAIFNMTYLEKDVTIQTFLVGLFKYEGTRYSWYIEMYIGLFLIIPFLNKIFNNLKDQKEANILLLVLFIVFGLPGIVNTFNFSGLEWLKQPSISNSFVKIIPNWWVGMYPIFYYFLGAYLSKYKVKLKTFVNIILLVLIIVLDGVYGYYRSYPKIFIKGTWTKYAAGTAMIKTFLLFNLLLKIKFKKENKIRGKILNILSDAVLPAYLISCIFDKIFYDILSKKVPIVTDRLVYAPLMVLLTFTCSLAFAIIIVYLYKIPKNILKKKNNAV